MENGPLCCLISTIIGVVSILFGCFHSRSSQCPSFPDRVNIWTDSVILGEYVQARCYVQSVTGPMEISSIQFYKGDDLLNSEKENVRDYWVSILQLKKSDIKEGIYMCEATTTNNFVMRTSFTLSDLLKTEMDVLDTEFDLRTSFRWGCPPQALDSKCAQDRIKEIEDWLKNTNCIILVTGKMGTGKTTLIRGITQEFMPTENTLLPHTKVVTPYAYIHDGAKCTMYDTPGLKDDEKNSNDYHYLKQMVQDPDVLIFAVKMTDFSLQEEDKHTIANVTEAYGWKVWRKAIFILTFANLVNKVGVAEKSIDNRINFEDIENRFRNDIANVLREAKVEEESLTRISEIVPVGLVSNPYIDGANDGQSWIDKFWTETNKVLRTSLNSNKYNFKQKKQKFEFKKGQ